MKKQKQYAFAKLLDDVPRGQYQETLDKFVAHLGVSRSQAYRYISATFERPVDIPIRTLIKAAEFFNLTVDELINHPPKAVPV